MNEQQYQQGFNEGYLITKYRKDLSNQLGRIKLISSRMDGFHEGRRQCLIEQIRSKKPDWLKPEEPNQFRKDKDAGLDLER